MVQHASASPCFRWALACGSCRCAQSTCSFRPLGPGWSVYGLTSLELDVTCSDIVVDGPLSDLTALQRLRLQLVEGDLEMHPAATLPPALTSLWVHGLPSPVPDQVSQGPLRGCR